MPRRARVLVCAFNKDIRDTSPTSYRSGSTCSRPTAWGSRALKAGTDHTRLDKDKLKRLVGALARARCGPLAHRCEQADRPGEGCRSPLPEGVERRRRRCRPLPRRPGARQRRSALGLSPEQAAELRAQLVEACSELLVTCGGGHRCPRLRRHALVAGHPRLEPRALGLGGRRRGPGPPRPARADRLLARPGARLLVVGDDRQAIYKFRGADARAFDTLAERFGCTILPLSITYRCPTSVVDLARTGAGLRGRRGRSGRRGGQRRAARCGETCPGDFVISRKNARWCGTPSRPWLRGACGHRGA